MSLETCRYSLKPLEIFQSGLEYSTPDIAGSACGRPRSYVSPFRILLASLPQATIYFMSNKKDWKTKLIHSDAQVPEGFRSLATPVYRASTVLFPRAAAASDHWNQHEIGYTYGLYGTPTTLELAAKVCELEKGFRTIITPGGQGA